MPILALVLNPTAPPARQVPRLDFLPEVDRRDVQRIFKSAIASKEPEALEAAWDVLEAIARQDYPEVLTPVSTDPLAPTELISVVQRKSMRSAIAIDRTSPLGNPFVMRSEKDRDLVCDLYSAYFFAVLCGEEPRDAVVRLAGETPVSEVWKSPSSKSFSAALQNLFDALKKGAIELGCHCAPKRCHGDTIKIFLLEQLITDRGDRLVFDRIIGTQDKEVLWAIAASVGGVDTLLPQLPAKARLHYVTHTR